MHAVANNKNILEVEYQKNLKSSLCLTCMGEQEEQWDTTLADNCFEMY